MRFSVVLFFLILYILLCALTRVIDPLVWSCYWCWLVVERRPDDASCTNLEVMREIARNGEWKNESPSTSISVLEVIWLYTDDTNEKKKMTPMT